MKLQSKCLARSAPSAENDERSHEGQSVIFQGRCWGERLKPTTRMHLTLGFEIRLVGHHDHGEVVAVLDAQYLLVELRAVGGFTVR